MLHHPFQLFQEYRDALDIFLFTKDDNIQSDADITSHVRILKISSLWQIHGNRVIRIHRETSRTEKADGLITDQSDLLLTIRAADCQQILVYAPRQHVVGLLHVGWRGLIPSPAGRGLGRGDLPEEKQHLTTIQSFFRILEREWNIRPQETLVGIGPSIRQCCAEYSEHCHPLRTFPQQFWKGNYIDLAGIADTQLNELGVSPSHIERHADCTACHPKRYWTYRGGDREKVLQGYTNVLAVQLA